ncbi:MAG: aldehyde dehydrogenase family protein, partial [Pirellulaceae bacterium]|nr:aldehyde dehydrogenase family protein [Pirellulaceae bacterium]
LDSSGLNDQARSELTQLEWFGPLLVIDRVADFDTAVDRASKTPYGLAASLLGGSREYFERFVDAAGAGVVNWNSPTTGAAGALPFGGLGDSGNHRPAGYFAIDFCSDPVASLEADQISGKDPWSIAT